MGSDVIMGKKQRKREKEENKTVIACREERRGLGRELRKGRRYKAVREVRKGREGRI